MKIFDKENIDELLEIRQIRQYFPPSKFCTIQYMHNKIRSHPMFQLKRFSMPFRNNRHMPNLQVATTELFVFQFCIPFLVEFSSEQICKLCMLLEITSYKLYVLILIPCQITKGKIKYLAIMTSVK